MKWITSFLTERTQQVKPCNTKSNWNYIHGRVPQGTKLDPVLLDLMINDQQTKCDSYKQHAHHLQLIKPTGPKSPGSSRYSVPVDNPKRHKNRQKSLLLISL